MRNVGQKIRELREARGMSQEELAKKVGYKSRSSINKIELQRDVPIKKAALIAKALDVQPAALLGWDDLTKEPVDLIVADKDRTLFAIEHEDSNRNINDALLSLRALEIAKKLNQLPPDKIDLIDQIIDSYSGDNNEKR